MPRTVRVFGPPGTGKTTRLIGIVNDELAAGVNPYEIVYTSFTKAAAREARDRAILRFTDYSNDDFPYFSTIHSICFRLLDLDREHVFSGKQVKEFCDTFHYDISVDGQPDEDSDTDLPGMMLNTDADYFELFLGWMRNLMLDFDTAYKLFSTQPGVPDTFNADTVKLYIKRRNEYKVDKGLFDFTDFLDTCISENLYPRDIKAIIADEYQDGSPLLDKLLTMWSEHAERFYIAGDPYQCLPTGTQIECLGNNKPVEYVVVNDEVVSATGNNLKEFGTVTRTYKYHYSGELVKITTKSGRQLLVTPNHTMFWYWAWSWNERNEYKGNGNWYVYLMKMGDKWRIGQTDKPAVRLRFEHGTEGILPIAVYKSEQEALIWEEIYSLKYGIPTMVFYNRGTWNGEGLSQESQDEIWSHTNSSGGAERLLHDLNKSWDGNIRPAAFTAKYKNRTYIHLLALHHDHDRFRRWVYWSSGVVNYASPENRGSRYLTNLLEARQFAQQKADELHGEVFEKWPFTNNHMYQPVSAGNILPGCYVPSYDNTGNIIDDMVTDVQYVPYNGDVYDLEVTPYNNFIANGVFVHNSIFTFMGADPSIFINHNADEDILLKQSYRCPVAIHDLARRVVKRFKLRYHDDDFIPAPGEKGFVFRNVAEGLDWSKIEGTTFYLHRTHWLLSSAYNDLIREGVPFGTTNGKQSPIQSVHAKTVATLYRLVNWKEVSIKEISKLMDYLPTKTDKYMFLSVGAKTECRQLVKSKPDKMVTLRNLPELGFTTDFLAFLNKANILEPLKLSDSEKSYFTRVIAKYGVNALDSQPNTILSTIHGVKGREADNVILNLQLTKRTYEAFIDNPDSEHRLMYVGVTRAKRTVTLLDGNDDKVYDL